METIGNRQLFEVQPEALNRVEEWTVLGQPDHQDTVFIEAQSGPNRFAVVVGGIIHHYNEMLAGVFSQQMLKESHKRIAVFVRRGEITDPSGVPVVATKDMEKLRTARGGD